MLDENNHNSGEQVVVQNGHVHAKISLHKIIFYAASIGFLLVVYFKWGEVRDLKDIFLKSHISWLLVAVFFQAISYHFVALNYQYIFKIKGHEVSAWSLYSVSFITKFLNNAFPTAGVSGQIFLIDYLRNRGATIAEGVGRAILEIASLFCGFGVIFIVGSILFFTTSAFVIRPELIWLVYLFWFFMAFFLSLFFIIQRVGKSNTLVDVFNYIKSKFSNGHGEQVIKNPGKIKKYWSIFTLQLVENMRMKSLEDKKGLFFAAIFWQCLIFLCNILTLYFLTLALDINVGFQLAFVAFTFTQFISMILFVPGSLVIYEGGISLLFIAFGVPAGSALTLAILFRILTFWVPMPIGWLLYRQYETNRHEMPVQPEVVL